MLVNSRKAKETSTKRTNPKLDSQRLHWQREHDHRIQLERRV
jgi:hypothetical protein